MVDTQTQTPETDEAQALRLAQAGYDKTATRSPELPVETPDVAASPAAQPLADSTSTPESLGPGDEANLEADPADLAAPDPISQFSEQLAAMRAQMQELKDQGVPATEMRKLHGEIGNINRSLQQLQAAKAAAPAEDPASDELAAALAQADEVAKEFPEIAGPLVKALKAFQAKAAAAPVQAPQPELETAPEQIPEAPTVDVDQLRQRERQQAAIDAIDELHPDRHRINATPEFKAWFASKTPEYQQKVTSTWNPAVLSNCYSEFKASLKARQRRQERLDAAAVPQGTGGGGGPTALPDEQGAWVGYNKKSRQA